MSKNTKVLFVSCVVISILVLLASFAYTYMLNKKSSSLEQELSANGNVPTEQEKALILKNGKSAGKFIEKYAIDTQVLTIGENCQIDPLIIRFKGDSVLVIENKDSKMHTIAFENQNFFTVSPNDKREINVNEVFNIKEGKLSYRCKEISEDINLGIMYVVSN